MNPILVTGATGTIGAHLVRELQEHGVQARAFVRDPARAAAALGGEVGLAVGDFADPASIRAALHGVQRVFLCSPNTPHQVAHETALIDAAVDAGIRRLVKIGASGARIGSPVAFWDAHGRIERHLRQSGLPSIVLHPSTYTSNLLASTEVIKQTGRLFAPAGEAKIALIDPRDVAAVATVVLTENGHEGRTYTLTGPEAVTYAEAAAQLSAAAGEPVEYVDVPDMMAREAMSLAGLPEWLADQLVILWGQLRGGAAAATTDAVRVLTGREPRPLAEFAGAYAVAFRS